MTDAIAEENRGRETIENCDMFEFMGKKVGATILHPGGMGSTHKLAKALGLPPAGNSLKLLDVACGKGSSSLFFVKKFGVSVTGIDMDKSLLDHANALRERTRGKLALRFVQGNAENLPFPDNSFDFIVFQAVFELMDNPELVMNEAVRVVKPGGKIGLLALTWVEPPPERILREAREKVCSICIGRAQSQDGWEHLLTGAGLRLTFSNAYTIAKKSNDEGFVQTIKILWRILTKKDVRTRMKALMDFIKHSRGYFGYGVFVGEKQ